MSVGVPIKVLHDAEGHTVTIETVDGNVYRGKLMEAEDNMNVYLTSIVMTTKEGRSLNVQSVYIRGSKIRFLILPDMLKNSPMLKKSQLSKGVASTKGNMGRAIRGRGFRGGGRGVPGRGFR